MARARLASSAELHLIRPALSTLRRRAVLLTGLASAVVLASAAWQPFADPAASARLEQARLASAAAEGVAAEWDLLMRAAAPPIADALTAVVARDAPRDEHADEADVERGAARVLLAEAERVELSRGDLPEALALVEDALSRNPARAEAARARVRGVQIAARLARPDDVRRHHDALVAADPRTAAEAVDGASALSLAVLAAGDAIDARARDAACARLAEIAARGRLALPGADPRVVRRGDGYALEPDARRSAFETMLVERCPGVRVDPGERALRSIALPLLDASDARAPLRDGAWTVHRSGDGLVFLRAVDAARVHVVLATIEQVGRRLDELARRRGLLGAGFAIDAVGTRDDLGLALRSPIELAPGVLSITLRHPDPDSIATGARRRAGWLRVGLIALAASIAAASFLAHRALARERRLADLRSRFVANVSHELRTPVASILLMAENLESGRANAASAPRYHAAIRGEALRLRRLVEDVLDFSRVERGRRIAIERADVDLDAWSAALDADLRELAARHAVELAFVAARPLGTAAIDGEALRRAAINLVDNAAKHSGSRRVDVSLRGDDAAITLDVRDHGRGIPLAQRAAIFEPFARLDEERGAPGAGLGLAIVREIAQAHGGTVRALDPMDGPGARFEITIPREGRTTDA